MRPKRRYIAFEVVGKTCKGEVARAIDSSLCGAPDFDRAALRLVLYEICSGRGLLRCGHRQVGEIKSAMSSVKRIGDRKASFTILGVSGTIRAAKRKFLMFPPKSACSKSL